MVERNEQNVEYLIESLPKDLLNLIPSLPEDLLNLIQLDRKEY